MFLGDLLQLVCNQVERVGSENVGWFGGIYEGGWQLQQRPVEFSRLVCLLAAYSPFAAYLEIGTASGGTTRFLAEWLRIGRTVIIDDGQHPKHSIWVNQNRKFVPGLSEFIGDSHCDLAGDFLRGLDCIFDLACVDGDHSYEGVHSDWKLIQPFLAPDALVWFHDIRVCEGVARFWAEVRQRFTVVLETDELGIGVLRFSSPRAV
jgi:hypothetical protein